MSLYLCAFSFKDKIEHEEFGVEVGTYSYFDEFRKYIHDNLEKRNIWRRFPNLLSHSDCDGVVTSSDSKKFIKELNYIKEELRKLPPDESIIKLRDGE